MTTKEILEYKIYPNLDKATALSDLNPQDKGSYYLVTCPECNKREAFVYKNSVYIKCNRDNHCGALKSIWDHIKESGNLSNKETLEKLAELSGYTLPESHDYVNEEIYKKS